VNFDLSDEQKLLQDTITRFAEAECPASRRRELFDAGDAYDAVLWKGLAELGAAGLHLPEEHGGAGLELLDLALAAEVLGHAAVPGPFLGHALAGLALFLGGSEEQQRRWLPALATGEALGSVALAEPGGRWLPGQWRLEAGDGLRGEKPFVPHARHADVVVVGTAGGGLALVETGAPGVSAEPWEGVDRTRPLDVLRLDGAAADPLPEGVRAAPRVCDAACVLLAADAWGGASRLVEDSVAYAKTREQFGVPIAQFQAVKHQLADMAIAVEPARHLVWFAAHAFDHLPDEAPRAAALAKSHLGDRFFEVARDAVEVHGGIGFTWECDVQIWYKRALFDRAFLGTPEVHRERAARLAGW